MIGIMQGRLSPPVSEKIQEFPWTMWENEFSLAKSIGVRIMEWTLDLQDFSINPFLTESGHKRIRYLSSKFDLLIESVTLDCFLDAPLHREHPETGAKSQISDLIQVIESSRDLGVKIGVLPLVVESGVDDQKSLALLMDILVLMNEKCRDSNFRIALECEFDLRMLQWIAGEIRLLKHVGFNFDIGNSASMNNDPAKELDIYGDKLFNVHIKDRLLRGKTVPLGQGNANFRVVASELLRRNYSGNMILQASRQNSTGELETIAEYLRFCKSYGWG
jgi:hexulose-6-phosphate isomerase